MFKWVKGLGHGRPGEVCGAQGVTPGTCCPGFCARGHGFVVLRSETARGGRYCVVLVRGWLVLACGRGRAGRRCRALQMGQDRARARWLVAWAKGYFARGGCRFSGR